MRGDTLRDPAFFDGPRLARFNCVIANPPFSLKNWGGEAWSSDRWGRNSLGGVPPKGYADWRVLLDEQGTGVVISSINGRQETRSYGKPVTAGESEYSLSDEERDAVRAALEQPRGEAMGQPGARRRRSRG